MLVCHASIALNNQRSLIPGLIAPQANSWTLYHIGAKPSGAELRASPPRSWLRAPGASNRPIGQIGGFGLCVACAADASHRRGRQSPLRTPAPHASRRGASGTAQQNGRRHGHPADGLCT